MKTKNSIKNSLISIFQYVVLMIIGFVTQKIFINILGLEYLGLNSLFTNIMSLLGIVELGIGSAIIYNLYKPLVNKDNKTINALMNFYKKAYHIIAIIILVLGLVFIPFLHLFINNITINLNINLVFILFLTDIVASYFLSYKRSILYADQKNYIVNLIHIISVLFLNLIQLLFLYLTKNYYIYLVIKIIFRILENIMITIYVNNKYKYIFDEDNSKLDEDIYNDIIKKVKALFFHKIAGFIINGTDNIIISKFIGLIVVGLYSNYYMIINAVNTLFGEAFNALTPSVGHLLVENNKDNTFQVFKKIRFINFSIACLFSVAILLLLEDFIRLWLGSDYLLTNITLIVLVIDFFQKMMRNTYLSFKNAAGIFYEDRHIPILESLTNIIFSIIFVIIMGLPGVFLGTIVSSFWLWFYSYPKYVYTKLFNRLRFEYFKETIGYLLVFIFVAVTSYTLSVIINFNNIYIEFIKNILISFVVPNVFLFVIFHKTDNFKYYIDLFRGMIRMKK